MNSLPRPSAAVDTRAVIRDTRILVMDEPTSGLDAPSERTVVEALGHLMDGTTSIVVRA